MSNLDVSYGSCLAATDLFDLAQSIRLIPSGLYAVGPTHTINPYIRAVGYWLSDQNRDVGTLLDQVD